MKNKIKEKIGLIVQNPFVMLITYIVSLFSFFHVDINNPVLAIVCYGFVALYLVVLTIYIIKRYFSIKTYRTIYIILYMKRIKNCLIYYLNLVKISLVKL